MLSYLSVYKQTLTKSVVRCIIILMEVVDMKTEPIRDAGLVKTLFTQLLQEKTKYGILFLLGVNTGLRISDLLSLRVSDIFIVSCSDAENFNKLVYGFKDYLTVVEKKTGKTNQIKLNEVLRKYLVEYVKENNMDGKSYLFSSQKNKSVPFKRLQAYRVMKEHADSLGIQNFGTHTMRKTFGYFFYKNTQNIALLMDVLNHSSQNITLRYIGISQDIKDQARERVVLGI